MDGPTSASGTSVRIDRWLLAARVFKTRPLAQQACEGGKVSVNGTRASAHKAVRPGDRVSVRSEHGPREFEILALGEKRLPFSEAALLYVDHSPPPEPSPGLSGAAGPPATRGGRPSKQDRRAIARLRGR